MSGYTLLVHHLVRLDPELESDWELLGTQSVELFETSERSSDFEKVTVKFPKHIFGGVEREVLRWKRPVDSCMPTRNYYWVHNGAGPWH
jgi:hypothetical protein